MSQSVKCEVVLSGISGRFPNADNLHELQYNLYNKVDMVDDQETRWQHFYDTAPKRSGKIRNIDKFDPKMFHYSDRQANYTDPQGRMLVEHCFEAAMDAGISPLSLEGSRTGVFVGCSAQDAKESQTYHRKFANGNLISNSQFLLANGISFVFGLNGPSFVVDTACSSSGYALDAAFKYIQNGSCDAAFVCGTQLDLNLEIALGYLASSSSVMDIEGISRPFDADANGFVRSESVCAIFLQKAKNAKRIYANLLYTKTNNDGKKIEGMFFPSKLSQRKLFEDFYDEIKIDPGTINYVEAHATGTIAGDPQEAWSIDKVFCKNRSKPLLIGSVKSNLGHAEAAAAMTSIAKVILTLESHKIPPNINLIKIRPEIEALVEGRLKVVTETENLDGPLIAINSFGLIGANSHTLLRGNEKEKINDGIPSDNLNRLLLWAGRTGEAVDYVFNDVTKRALDAEHIALLQNTQTKTYVSQVHRGFGIFKHDIGSGRAVCVKKEIQQSNTVKRPIVWVYSGVGSQWIGMGRALMNIPIFANTIEKCHEVLSSVNVDLKNILLSDDVKIFDDIVNTFIGITAVQIGLTDILKAIDLSPDYIIGHSIGELGCAYADEGLTIEETILTSHARGVACKEAEIPRGRMAVVGMKLEELKKCLPNDIDIACHNTFNLYTVSGLIDSVEKFVNELSSQNIFTRNVDSALPFHSRYIANAGPLLFKKLSEIISHPKPRSVKWLSSSVNDWNSEESKMSSAFYHTNNLTNPVLFAEACEKLPPNALTVEIAPSGLLQAVLKRSMKEGVHLSLTLKAHEDGALCLMEALGRIFQNGYDLDVSKLYPSIDFPVSRGTPMISPIIKWDHSESFYVPFFDPMIAIDRRIVIINLRDENYKFLRGHEVDGKILLPGMSYAFFVWEAFAMMNGLHYTKARVQIDDMKFLRATLLNESSTVILTVAITRGTNRFEITDGSVAVATGYIKLINQSTESTSVDAPPADNCIMLQQDDFYKVALLKGFKYSGLFRAVKEIRSDANYAKIEWHNNWLTFLDTNMQIEIAYSPSAGLGLPRSIRKIIIDPELQMKLVRESNLIEASVCRDTSSIQGGGVQITGVINHSANRRIPNFNLVIASYKFVPHFPTPTLTPEKMIHFSFQLFAENSSILNLKFVEIDSEDGLDPLLLFVHKLCHDLPLLTVELNYLTSKTVEIENIVVHNNATISSFAEANVLIHLKADNGFFELVQSTYKSTTYIICQDDDEDLPSGFNIIANVPLSNDKKMRFICFLPTQHEDYPILIEITTNFDDYTWLPILQKAIEKKASVILYSQSASTGILGLVKCLHREPNGANIRCFIIDDETAPNFDLDLPFYKSQLQLGWSINVYQNGSWGTYLHMWLTSATETSFENSHCYIDSLSRGDLSQLTWIKKLQVEQNSLEKSIDVHYAALNFRDAMIASGRIGAFSVKDTLKQQSVLGMEFSGIEIQTGRRVMGIKHFAGAIATSCQVEDDVTLFDVPDSWTLEEAATVPLVYATVYLAFFIEADIRKIKSILIHAGCGGVGLAAIQVALSYGLNVFTTVSTQEKRNYLLDVFPTLNPNQIGNSRDTSFEKMIMKTTRGQGVDLVLNSLSEEKLQASLRCVAENGIFLEIGKYDILLGTNISMDHFKRGITIKPVYLSHKSDKTVENVFRNDINRNFIKPLKSNIFKNNEVTEAFRFLASGKHIGKVLISVKEEAKESPSLNITPQINFNPEHVSIIVGGLGGFGMELAGWMIKRGVEKLVLTSRRGITNSYQSYMINYWKSYGIQVEVSTFDVTTADGCQSLINEASKLGVVEGIWNLAVVLQDRIFSLQTEEMFTKALKPKAHATVNLSEISIELCPQLKYFVVFSSVSCGFGNFGQTNYGMANSIMEHLMEKRRSLNLPAKAIQFGPISEVGLIAENNIQVSLAGLDFQPISSCIQALDRILIAEDTIVLSMVVAEKQSSKLSSKNVKDIILSILGIKDINSVRPESTLGELGMDSLISVEVSQVLANDYDVQVTSDDVKFLKINELENLVRKKEMLTPEQKN